MRRVFSVCAIALLSVFSANAQIELCAGYAYGLTGNVSVASNGDEKSDFASSQGFYIAAIASSRELQRGIKLKYTLVYSYLIGNESSFLRICEDPRYTVISNTGKVVTDEHYLRIPIELGFDFQIVRNLRGFGYFGPALNFCLSSKSYATWPNIQGTNHWNVDHFAKETNYNGYKRFDVMIEAGAGFEVMKQVRLDFGGSYGLTDRSSSSPKLHHFVWHIGLSVLLNLKKSLVN